LVESVEKFNLLNLFYYILNFGSVWIACIRPINLEAYPDREE